MAKAYGIQRRRTYTKEVKNLRLAIRHFRHVKRRAKAKKALKRLRTIAGILIRELRRTLPQYALFETHQKDFLFYERVLAQQPKDKNKVTPYQKLKSLPYAKNYLKPGVTFEILDKLSMEMSDNEAAEKLQKERRKLFKSTFEQDKKYA
ncbi:MAG: hypothetical protein Q9N32_00940 [Gammaproteobacteria bacterium]|nr:hypothetical protein [Gammaproteobacteria bacterium]